MRSQFNNKCPSLLSQIMTAKAKASKKSIDNNGIKNRVKRIAIMKEIAMGQLLKHFHLERVPTEIVFHSSQRRAKEVVVKRKNQSIIIEKIANKMALSLTEKKFMQ